MSWEALCLYPKCTNPERYNPDYVDFLNATILTMNSGPGPRGHGIIHAISFGISAFGIETWSGLYRLGLVHWGNRHGVLFSSFNFFQFAVLILHNEQSTSIEICINQIFLM